MIIYDKRFDDFIKKSEKKFKDMKLNEDMFDIDNWTVTKENEVILDDLMKNFYTLFNKVWNDVGNKLTVDKMWKNHYQESEYNYVFDLFQ